MPWLIVPMVRWNRPGMPILYVPLRDYEREFAARKQPLAIKWSATECGAGQALVYVEGDAEALAALAADERFLMLPDKLMDAPLSDVSDKQAADIQARLLEMGYELREVQEKLAANLKQVTLRQVLQFCSQRRVKPVLVDDVVTWTGEAVDAKPVEDVLREVGEARAK